LNSISEKKIVVVGGYGYTGKLICTQLLSQGITFSIVGRDQTKLTEFEIEFQTIKSIHQVDISKKEEAQKLINDFDIIINCAGPFTEESQEFVRLVSLSENKIYLDISGESEFVKKSFEENNSDAQQNNTLLIHACAFESFVADLALQILVDSENNIETINSYYYFENSRPSPGTRLTMKLSKYRKYHQIKNQNWHSYKVSDEIHTVDFGGFENNVAVPYPLPDIAFAFYNYKPKNAMSYLIVSKQESLFFSDDAYKEGNASQELQQLRLRKTQGPTVEERVKQKCHLFVHITLADKTERQLHLETIDMYKVTAKAISCLMHRLIEEKPIKIGVVSPAFFFRGEEKIILEKISVQIFQTN